MQRHIISAPSPHRVFSSLNSWWRNEVFWTNVRLKLCKRKSICTTSDQSQGQDLHGLRWSGGSEWKASSVSEWNCFFAIERSPMNVVALNIPRQPICRITCCPSDGFKEAWVQTVTQKEVQLLPKNIQFWKVYCELNKGQIRGHIARENNKQFCN